MLIITFGITAQVPCASKIVVCNAGERYIFETLQGQAIIREMGDAVHEVSDLSPYLAGRKPPEDWRGKRALWFRRGALGDQLMLTAVTRYFSEVLGARCFVAAEREQVELWMHDPCIEGWPLLMPINLDTVWRGGGRELTEGWRQKGGFFDYAWFIESAYEHDHDSEQPNAYDRLFSMCGIDPERVPDAYKRPHYVVKPEDEQKRDSMLEASNGYIILQPLSADATRSLPLSVIRKVLQATAAIAEETGLKVLMTHHEPFSDSLRTLISEFPHAADGSGAFAGFSLFAAVVAGAKAVIGPDSVGLHLAAAFNLPAVAIWGSHDPACRAKYYARQENIFHPERCGQAPCYNTRPTLPFNRCPDGDKQVHCAVYDGVQAQEIEDALRSVMGLRLSAAVG